MDRKDEVMIGRMLVMAVMLGAVAFGGSSNPSSAAPAAVDIGELSFSDAVDDQARPINPRIDFEAGVETVFVSFEYRNYEPGTQMSYIVRANDQDFRFGDLDCCGSRDGRYAFAIERRSGRDLGGAAYDVRIYAGDDEVAQGGFGVEGTQGFDDDDDDDNDND